MRPKNNIKRTGVIVFLFVDEKPHPAHFRRAMGRTQGDAMKGENGELLENAATNHLP